MKKIFLITVLFFCLIGFAQHPDLQAEKWFIESITINGNTTNIPNHPVDFPYADIFFFSTTSGIVGSQNSVSWIENNCSIGFSGHVNYNGSNSFDFTDFSPFQTTSGCTAPLIDFMQDYVSIFSTNITQAFNYTITDETDGSKTLQITGNNGDYIIYTNTFFNTSPSEFSDNLWYLHYLIIDGEQVYAPDNDFMLDVQANFISNDNQFIASACSFYEGNTFFDYSQNKFYLYETVTTYGIDFCSPSYPENNIFTTAYIYDFHIQHLPGPFTYTYTVNGNEEMLVVVNASGNQAVYGNSALSIQDLQVNNSVFVYPNPVNDVLYIKNQDVFKINKAEIYDVQGKLLYVSKEIKNTIDVSSLQSGLLFIKIYTNKGFIIKKVVKK